MKPPIHIDDAIEALESYIEGLQAEPADLLISKSLIQAGQLLSRLDSATNRRTLKSRAERQILNILSTREGGSTIYLNWLHWVGPDGFKHESEWIDKCVLAAVLCNSDGHGNMARELMADCLRSSESGRLAAEEFARACRDAQELAAELGNGQVAGAEGREAAADRPDAPEPMTPDRL